jgi:two-component system chemotaxis sensor kinase CheA
VLDRVARGEPESDASLQMAASVLIGQLQALTGDESCPPMAGTAASTAPEAATSAWRISVQFKRDLFRKRIDPLDILHYLNSFGQIDRLATHVDRIPDAGAMDPESCYLGFDIDFSTAAERPQIEQAFQLAGDDCTLKIVPPQELIDERIRAIENLPDEALPLGEVLLRSGAVSAEDLAGSLASQGAARSEDAGEATSPPLGEVLVKRHAVAEPVVEAAVERQKEIGRKRAAEARQVRVAADKLDLLVDMVGELVTSTASASAQAKDSGQNGLIEANAGVSRLVEGIRELSLKLRMVPIGDTFSRLRRMVRDLAREMNREVDFIVSGEETELDKTVVEKIGDPLMHLLRNAIDHGLEPAAERLAHGKPAKGRIELKAYHETGGIVIEVADDGSGLDREKILAKAVERGLVAAGDAPTDQEIFNLIFEAGFSTADKITNLSGRGVGMDVVRSNVRALRGSIEVESGLGQGSRFIMRLPLTMAIIDGFLVGIGNAYYVIPLERVVECTDLIDGNDGRDVFDLRGEVIPCIRLRQIFAASAARPRRESVVVVRHGERKVCLVVDLLHGECQSVIKPLSTVFGSLRGVAGATILGSGEVALILDVHGLIDLAGDSERRRLDTARQITPDAAFS